MSVIVQPGERYRMVIEGVWTPDYPVDLADLVRDGGFDPDDDTITVEKVVEIFQPGDLVESLNGPNGYVLITNTGYVEIQDSKHRELGGHLRHVESGWQFTSEVYRKVGTALA